MMIAWTYIPYCKCIPYQTLIPKFLNTNFLHLSTNDKVNVYETILINEEVQNIISPTISTINVFMKDLNYMNLKNTLLILQFMMPMLNEPHYKKIEFEPRVTTVVVSAVGMIIR